MSIEVKNIGKTFSNGFLALKDINLNINSGELIALLGPSGSGKTTLLRIIAGLEKADQGTIFFNNEDISNKQVKDRKVGFVFQHYALFKNMTVFDNVAFGLKVMPSNQRPNRHKIEEKVLHLLKLVHLQEFADRYPNQLSGGQRQRVALARALAVEPKILLLDEPFGALDAKVRQSLRRWMRKLHDEMHITSIFVTHDQEEAMEVADKIIVMSNGKIEQQGTPEEVYNNPANSFVYDFLGNYNEFFGIEKSNGEIELKDFELKEEYLNGNVNIEQNSKIIHAYCRPYDLKISKDGVINRDLTARIIHINSAGPIVKIELEDGANRTIFCEISRNDLEKEGFKKNDKIFIFPQNIRVFDK